MLNRANMRHYVDILDPTSSTGSRGEAIPGTRVLMSEVPCSITPLSGREGEIARQIVAQATHTVELRGPIAGLSTKSSLREIGNMRQAATGPVARIMHIGNIDDPLRTGHELTLLVTEEV